MLFLGDVLSPPLLQAFPPFTSGAPPRWQAETNELLIDVPTQLLPWTLYARNHLRGGDLPVWNPLALGGTPFLDNPQTALFSPFNLPVWLLPLAPGLALSAAAKLWVGGFGTYKLVRELALGFWPGLVAAIGFALCSFNVVWLAHSVQPAVAAFLPVALWLSERTLRRGGPEAPLALALALALAFLGGHPGTAGHVLAATLLYALLRAALLSGISPRGRLRRFLGVLCAAALGVMLVAFLLIPSAMAAREGIGRVAREGGGITLPLSALRTLLLPDWWGRPSGAYVPSPANYNERTVFTGVTVLLLAAISLRPKAPWARIAPFLVLGALGLAVPFDAPVIHAAVVALPGFDVIQNARLLLWSLLALAVLAAFGADAVASSSHSAKWIWLAPLAALGGLATALAGARPSLHDLELAQNHFRTGRDYLDVDVLGLTAAAWAGLALAAVAALLWLRPRLRPDVRLGLLACLVVAESLRYASGYQPTVPIERVLPHTPPSVSFLVRHANRQRVTATGDSLPTDSAMRYGLREARGKDAPQPSRAFFALWQVANPAQIITGPLRIPTLTSGARRLLELLSVRYVLLAPGERPPRSARIPVVYSGPDARIVRLPSALPRAWVPVLASPLDDFDVRARLAFGPWDPRREAFLPPGNRSLPRSPGGRAWVRAEDAEEV